MTLAWNDARHQSSAASVHRRDELARPAAAILPYFCSQSGLGLCCGWQEVNRMTYWSQGVASLPHKCQPPSPTLDNIRVMVIVWRLRGNIIRTAPCWVMWHNIHRQQHTHVSSSYRSSRLGLSHRDPYAMHRGGCLELYCCNMVEWFWWYSSLIWKTNWLPSLLWHWVRSSSV